MTAYDQAVEVMAQAAYACPGGAAGRGHRDWDRAGERNQDIWRAEAKAALDALLAARRDIPCPTCGGTGSSSWVQSGVRYMSGDVPCRDCSNGVVPGPDPLVILGPEQMRGRWWEQGRRNGIPYYAFASGHYDRNLNCAVYREGTPDES